MIRHFPILCAVILSMAFPVMAADWRIDLLKENGIGTSESDLKKTSKEKPDLDELEKAFQQLSSESYPERIKAQKLLIAKGANTLEFLRNKKGITNPETRARVSDIEKELKNSDLIGLQNMIQLAKNSLLNDRKADDTGGIFYEWFGTDTKHCDDGYRSFIFDAADRHSAWVVKGRLRLLGKRNGEVDQRMILRSKDWPQSDELPDRFSVSARVGGEDVGSGLWHAGISIGNVKALIHPGYPGGAFRIEQVGTLEKYISNQEMGFTPENDELCLMTVLVERKGEETIKLTATVNPDDHPAFTKSIELDAVEFGDLNQISLDRSGHPGGDAIFDDLFIDLNPR